MTDSLIDPKPTDEVEPNHTTEISLAETVAGTDPVNTAEETTAEESSDTEEKFYAGKYKSVEELEKGYKEAVTKLTEKNPSAPDEYVYDFSEDPELSKLIPEGFDFASDPLVQAMEPFFKEKNLQQEDVTAMMGAYIKQQSAVQPDIGEELKKLGPEANNMILAVETFVGRNFNESEQAIAADIASTAEGLKLLHKMAKINNSAIPTSSNPTDTMKSSYEDLRNEQRALKAKPNFDMDLKAKQQYEAIADEIATRQLKESGKL